MLFSDIELTLTAEGSDRNNKTEKRARQFFFPLLMWLLPHGTNLYFARKNLGVCFLKNLEPGLIQKCPLLTLPASLWDVLCCPPPPHRADVLAKGYFLGLCLSPSAFSFACGWSHLLQHREAPEPIHPEPFCRLHFGCPLLSVVSILKCLCNSSGSAGVLWFLKILIRLAWMPISCPVENLVSSPRRLLIPGKLWASLTASCGSHFPAPRNRCLAPCTHANSLSLLAYQHALDSERFLNLYFCFE